MHMTAFSLENVVHMTFSIGNAIHMTFPKNKTAFSVEVTAISAENVTHMTFFKIYTESGNDNIFY